MALTDYSPLTVIVVGFRRSSL